MTGPGGPSGAQSALPEAQAGPTGGVQNAAPSGPEKSPPSRLVLLKMALVLTGLGVLLVWTSRGLPADRPPVSPLGILVAVLLNQAALLVAALRLRATLTAFRIRLGSGQAFVIHLRSLFYFFFVPLSIGYEVARYLAVRRIDSSVGMKQIVLALLMDRVLGLFAALVAMASLAPLVLPAVPWPTPDPTLMLAGAGFAAGLGVLLLAHGSLRRRVLEVIVTLGRSWRRLVVPALLSLTALALVCASVYVFAVGSGLLVGWAQVAFALSASLLGMAVPLSLLGVTLGEAAGAGTLALVGLSPGEAVLLASVAYCGRLLGAVQGAAIELLGDAGGIRGGG